jgi:hypothetical protein
MSSAAPVIEEANGGELLWFGGGLLTLKVTSEQSGGAFFLLEDVETFYVLEGELLVHIDGTERTVGPGAVAFVPRGKPHAFLVTSDEARWLGFVTPGTNIERFMRDAGDAVTDPTSPIPPLDIARIKAAGERTGAMVALGPPPFELAAKHPA